MYTRTRLTIICVFLLLCVAGAACAITDSRKVEEVGVDERLGGSVPMGLELTDMNGRSVTLGDSFDGERPVVLTLVYYRCPRLCTYVLGGLVEVLSDFTAFSLGADYRVVSVSINPLETPDDAQKKAEGVLRALGGREGVPEGAWSFLTTNSEAVATLTASVGFRYIEDGDEFAHPSVLIVLTPEGKVSRYLYGIEHSLKDFRLALLEASQGEIGSAGIVDKVLLYCYKFDPVGKKYALHALNILKGGGIITLFSVGVLIAILVISERKKRMNGG